MKKKILVIGPGMEVGGVERSLIGLLNAFDYEKYEVDLFLMSHTGEFMPHIHPKVNLLNHLPRTIFLFLLLITDSKGNYSTI